MKMTTAISPALSVLALIATTVLTSSGQESRGDFFVLEINANSLERRFEFRYEVRNTSDSR